MEKIRRDISIINTQNGDWLEFKRRERRYIHVSAKIGIDRMYADNPTRIENMTARQRNNMDPVKFAFSTIHMMENTGWYGKGCEIEKIANGNYSVFS